MVVRNMLILKLEQCLSQRDCDGLVVVCVGYVYLDIVNVYYVASMLCSRMDVFLQFII